ncbi:hypothetical protein M011DRAFT_525835 [Sporormia fimetaria CBS 119925]|uniref:CENP-V/GFA domain-containing protein n=1 Tax=Sporormia fimetaria CBS 119925 TaxID=1340428 RepID=A0A6A6VGF1_9PLEO|nr:hypothetical protein M011DRAFT_525835 [Sporormia fimetaria CBS 119925]
MSSRPSQITGGCLCGSLRYTLTFPPSTPWPPKSATCQCTMCRKWTGTLLPSFLTLPSKQITPWPLSSSSGQNTYTEYASSSKGLRGFCGTCGSSLIWRSKEEEEVDLYLGTVDEKWLVDEKEVAKAIATPNQFQFWCQHAVDGVTDMVKGGQKLLRDRGTEMG